LIGNCHSAPSPDWQLSLSDIASNPNGDYQSPKCQCQSALSGKQVASTVWQVSLSQVKLSVASNVTDRQAKFSVVPVLVVLFVLFCFVSSLLSCHEKAMVVLYFGRVHDFMVRPLLRGSFWHCPFCCWSIFEQTFLAQILQKYFFLLLFVSIFLI